MFRKMLPVPVLMLLSPLIAEYVLGNLPTDKLYYLPVLCLMYGAGTVFVREVTRRINKGWLPFVLLAAGYGLMEEGLVTQSIFNPDYMHLGLLNYGFVPSLHTALPWACYAVSIHVIWSLAVPIGLVDALFPARRNEPWLEISGLAVVGLLFVAGSTWLGFASIGQNEGFTAPVPQLMAAASVILLLVLCAFFVPAPQPSRDFVSSPAKPVHPIWFAIVAFVCGSAFQLSHACGNAFWHWPWEETIGVMALSLLVFLVVIFAATRNRPTTAMQAFAMALGGVMVYVWIGFLLEMKLYGKGAQPGHIVLDAVILSLFGLGLFQSIMFERKYARDL